MSRHTSPNKQRVDNAFPIRVKIKIPPNGLGNLLDDIHTWLQAHVGDTRYSNQSVKGVYCHATAYYFRDLSDAQAFLDTFPMLDLADGLDKAES